MGFDVLGGRWGIEVASIRGKSLSRGRTYGKSSVYLTVQTRVSKGPQRRLRKRAS